MVTTGRSRRRQQRDRSSRWLTQPRVSRGSGAWVLRVLAALVQILPLLKGEYERTCAVPYVRQRTDENLTRGDASGVIKQHLRRPTQTAALLVLAAALGGTICLPVRAESFDVPELSNPANHTHLVGKLIWLDLETTDLPGAKRFYHALFGWDYRDYHADDVDYTVAMVNGTPVAGLVRRQILNQTERRSAWLPFFSVADVTATFQQALKAHAQVRSEPEQLPLRGRQARLTDPEGAVFVRVFSTADTARQAVKLGGHILVAADRATHGATSAILADPTGAAFGVTELPPEIVNLESP